MAQNKAKLAQLEELFGQYWDIAFTEGSTGVNQSEKANGVLHALRLLLDQPEDEPVTDTGQYRITADKIVELIVYAKDYDADKIAALLKSLPVLDQPEGEPKAWLIKFKDTDGTQRSRSYTHNAIGDYRQIDPDATSEELYTHAQPLQPITADDVTDEMIDELARRCPTMNSVEVDRQTIAASFNIYNTYLAGEAT